MYKPSDSIFIVSSHTGAIPYLRQNGPIVSPIKVSISTVRRCLIAGVRLSQFDPVTKKIVALNLQNLMDDKKFEKAAEPFKKPEQKTVTMQEAPKVEIGRGMTQPVTMEVEPITATIPPEQKTDEPSAAEEVEEADTDVTEEAPVQNQNTQQHNGKKNKKNR